MHWPESRYEPARSLAFDFPAGFTGESKNHKDITRRTIRSARQSLITEGRQLDYQDLGRERASHKNAFFVASVLWIPSFNPRLSWTRKVWRRENYCGIRALVYLLLLGASNRESWGLSFAWRRVGLRLSDGLLPLFFKVSSQCGNGA